MDDAQYDVILEDVDESIRPRKIKPLEQKKQQTGGWQFAALTGQVGFDIALPMVLGLIIGVKLDTMWGTRPKAALVLFILGLIIACVSLIRIVKEAISRK